MEVPCIKYRNALHTELKVCEAIEDLPNDCIEENICKYAVAVHNTKGCIGDIWWNLDDELCCTCRWLGCMDRGGLTRTCSRKIKGAQAVLINWSIVINKPIMIFHHQTKCVL